MRFSWLALAVHSLINKLQNCWFNTKINFKTHLWWENAPTSVRQVRGGQDRRRVVPMISLILSYRSATSSVITSSDTNSDWFFTFTGGRTNLTRGWKLFRPSVTPTQKLVTYWTGECQLVVMVTSQQALDGQQDGADVIECWPFVLQDVETDETLFVHIGMKTRRDKLHTRSLIWVTSWEVQRQPVPEAVIHLRDRQVRGKSGLNVPPTAQRDWLVVCVYILCPGPHRWSRPIWRDYLILETQRFPYHLTSESKRQTDTSQSCGEDRRHGEQRGSGTCELTRTHNKHNKLLMCREREWIICSETTQMLSYILSNILSPYIFASLTNGKWSELINRPKYFCVNSQSTNFK